MEEPASGSGGGAVVMDAQEIRMRCLEAAQLATKTPAIGTPDAIVTWAKVFEAFVTGEEPKAAKAKTPKVAA